MKYLKSYNYFKENLEIEETDEESVKVSKEQLNQLKEHISEFKSKKSAIDSLYKKFTLDKKEQDLKSGLEKILGVEENKNPFLVSYANISSIKSSIETLQKKSDDKAIELSNFKDRLSIAEDPQSKLALTDKIKVIQKQMTDMKIDLDNKIKKIPELEKELNDNIKKSEEDMKKWIENIQ